MLLCGASVAPGAGGTAAPAGGGTAGKGPQKGKMPGGNPGNMPRATGENTRTKEQLNSHIVEYSYCISCFKTTFPLQFTFIQWLLSSWENPHY